MLNFDYMTTIDFEYKYFICMDAPKIPVTSMYAWVKEFWKINPLLHQVWPVYDEFENAWTKEYLKIVCYNNDARSVCVATFGIIDKWGKATRQNDEDHSYEIISKVNVLYRFMIGTKRWCNIDWHNLDVTLQRNGRIYLPKYQITFDADASLRSFQIQNPRWDLLKMIDYGVPDFLLVKADKRTQENVVG